MSERARTVVEVIGAFVIATAAASILYHLQFVAFIRANLHALVAAVFLVLPQIFLRKRGDIEKYGFTTHPRKLGLAIAAVGVLGILPLFVGGFWIYERMLGVLSRHPALRLPPGFLQLVAAQLIVVALPEELFFRGFVQGRLEEAFPPQRKFLGAPVGGALVATAALFGVGHFFVTFEPQMLTRFFPGLVFGWMFARTRSILAGTIFHASCNLLMDVLARSFLT
jgi:membrane protease YdiL (CAAX protease family)